MQSKLIKMKEGGKKLAVYPAMGAVTVLCQGRSPVWFIFVFWPHLAVCLAHSQGPFGGRGEDNDSAESVYTQPAVVQQSQ